MNGVVSLSNVGKSYRNVVALRDVSFEVKRGEIFGYIGPNGAGKTTTIRIMVGLLGSYQGSVSINGITLNGNKEKINKMLGYLPQRASFQDWRTVDQALTTFGRLSGIPRGELDGRIKTTLDRLGILEYRNRKVTALSGGTLQKVGMAQAILHDPELLVLDEPVAGLDPESRFAFKGLFKELRKEGRTIFFSSHILSDVEDLADRIGVLSAGRLVYQGTVDELNEQVRTGKQVFLELSKDAGFERIVGSLKGVVSYETLSPGHFLLHLEEAADVDEAIDGIIRQLVSQGLQIRAVYPKQPTLEQLYVNYLQKGVVQ
ncbi:MAG: ABC transporter ATP-binding protein [Methanomassiliicoccales archaeon]|nr:ABC transporter ATP-binding protein [Methanomassiliicoccales archaeon]